VLLAFQNCPGAKHQKSKIDREQLDTKLHRFISEPPVIQDWLVPHLALPARIDFWFFFPKSRAAKLLPTMPPSQLPPT
jgi:hypothetical protein